MPSFFHKSFHHSLLHFPTDPKAPCPDDHYGPQCLCYEDNTAYYGNNDRFGNENPQKTRLDCQQSCEFHPSCHFWTFRKPLEKGGSGLCYLKVKRDNVTPNVTDYVSGSKKCRLPEWTGTTWNLRRLFYIKMPKKNSRRLTKRASEPCRDSQILAETQRNL